MSKQTFAISLCALFLVHVLLGGAVAFQIWIDRKRDESPERVEFVPSRKSPAIELIDLDVFVAYEKLGAVFGHWWFSTSDRMLYWNKGVEPPSVWEGGPPSRELPGFEFRTLPKEKLPAVDVPFGLYLAHCQVTEAELKELKQMKNLKLIQLEGQFINMDDGK